MRLGIAHHLGWAIAVTSGPDHQVADRRRIALVEPGLPSAPIHHEGGPHPLHRHGEALDDEQLAELVARVRTSVRRSTVASLDTLAAALPAPIASISLRAIPAAFPTDIAVQRRVPYESRADSVMYLQALAEAAQQRQWAIHTYDPKNVEAEASDVLGERSNAVLHGPRTTLGAPWTKDHRIALAATVMAAQRMRG